MQNYINHFNQHYKSLYQHKGGVKLKKERLEQLKKIFKSTAKKVFDTGYDNTIRLKETDEYFNVVADQLVYEVKIRGTDRKE